MVEMTFDHFDGAIAPADACSAVGQHRINVIAAKHVGQKMMQVGGFVAGSVGPLNVSLSLSPKVDDPAFTGKVVDATDANTRARAKLVYRDLEKVGLEKEIRSGVVLVGGGAEMDGMVEMVEQVFDQQARRGVPRGLGGLAADTPVLTTTLRPASRRRR